MTAITLPASNEPLRRGLRIIRCDTGIPLTIPAGAIALFDSEPLPPDWTRYSAQDGYFIKGVMIAGAVLGSNTHSHIVSTGPPSSTVSVRAGINLVASDDTHVHSEMSDTQSNEPPYIEVILAQANSETTIPPGMIGMFNETPGGCWTVVSDIGGDLYHRFVKGSSSYGTTGGAESHSHANLTITTPPLIPRGARTGTNIYVGSATHTHDILVSFSTDSHLPPYRDVIFAKLEIITAQPSSNSPVCEGSTINLFGGPDGMASYNWYGPGGWTSTDRNPTRTADNTTAGTYYLSVVNSQGCTSDNATVNVIVNPLPKVDAGPDQEVCENGNPINLTGEDPSGGTWSGTGVSGSQFNPAGLAPGDYPVMYSYTNPITQCSNSDNKTVTINAIPVATASSNSPVCVGGTINLFGGPDGMASYNWYGPGGWTSTDRNPTRTADNTTAGTYYLSVVNSQGCTSDNATVNVIVNPLPKVDAGPDQEVCENGNPINLTGEDPSGGTWSGTGVSGSQFNPAGLAPGDYPVMYSYTNPITQCSNSDNKTVTINAIPVATASSNSPVCEGGTIQLSGGSDNMTSYSWTGPDGWTSNNQNPSRTPATTAMDGTYTLIVTDAKGCTSDNATISVNVRYCGGVGGGGGLPAAYVACPVTMTAYMPGNITTVRATKDGVLCDTCLAKDAAAEYTLELDKDTKVMLADNTVPLILRFSKSSTTPPTPENTVIIGPVYELNAYSSTSETTPSPVTISPPAKLTLTYNPDELHPNTTEVFIANYDTAQGWLAQPPVPGTVAEIGKAQCLLGHFSIFAVLAKVEESAPAKFETSNLTIEPSQAQPNQEITISLDVANTGGTTGDYTLELKVNGISNATKQATIAAGASQTVSFTITENTAGKHQIEIAGLKGGFVVTGPPTETNNNWWLIGSIIAAVILALGLWILIRWRRFSGY